MTQRLEACYFGPDPNGYFLRMAAVLELTASQHCSAWVRTVRRIQPEPRTSALGLAQHVVNTQKLEHWAALVAAASDGEHLLLMDADTAILRSLDDVWVDPFDIAYTTKRKPFPFNLGVIFVRVNARSRAFFSAWLFENDRLLREPGDAKAVTAWRTRYGGINQASFAAVLNALPDGLMLKTLPCAEWNCEESGWMNFGSTTRILHIKGALRRAIFRREDVFESLRPASDAWRALERNVSAIRRTA